MDCQQKLVNSELLILQHPAISGIPDDIEASVPDEGRDFFRLLVAFINAADAPGGLSGAEEALLLSGEDGLDIGAELVKQRVFHLRGVIAHQQKDSFVLDKQDRILVEMKDVALQLEEELLEALCGDVHIILEDFQQRGAVVPLGHIAVLHEGSDVTFFPIVAEYGILDGGDELHIILFFS